MIEIEWKLMNKIEIVSEVLIEIWNIMLLMRVASVVSMLWQWSASSILGDL